MKKIISIPFARKRKDETNYRKRLKLILSGKTRLVVRKTSSQIIVQLVNYSEKGDNVIVSAASSQLKKMGWQLNCKNAPAAYLTGLMVGKLAHTKKVSEAILDAGATKPESRGRIYAALKGAIDGGLIVPASEEILPSADRITGKHLKSAEKAAQMFNIVKAKIAGEKK